MRAWVICLDSRGGIHSSAADGDALFPTIPLNSQLNPQKGKSAFFRSVRFLPHSNFLFPQSFRSGGKSKGKKTNTKEEGTAQCASRYCFELSLLWRKGKALSFRRIVPKPRSFGVADDGGLDGSRARPGPGAAQPTSRRFTPPSPPPPASPSTCRSLEHTGHQEPSKRSRAP